MTGPEGALFGPMANTYAFAICGALLLAVTLTPVLCSYLFHNKKEEKETFVDRIMKLRYLIMLDRVLRHRYLLLAAMGALLVFTITLIPKLGGEFMPPLEEGNLWIRAILPRTVTLQEAARMAPRLREVIGSIPEIKGVMSQVGRPDDGTDVTSYFNLEFNAPLTPMEQWRTKPVMILGHEVWSAQDHPRGDPGRADGEVQGVPLGQLQLLAVDPRQRRGGALGRQGGQLDQALRQRPGQVWRSTASGCSTSSTRCRASTTRGCSTSSASPTWRSRSTATSAPATGSTSPTSRRWSRWPSAAGAFTQMVEGEKKFDIVLRLPDRPARRPGGHRPDPGRRAPARTASPGRGSRCGSWSRSTPHKPGATYIYRENNRRYIPIKFSVQDRDLASTIHEAEQKVERPEVRRACCRRDTTSTGRASSSRCRRPTAG